MVEAAERASLLALPAPFGVHRLALGAHRLHFGLFIAERPEMSLAEAQDAMVERLLALLPPPPATVLHAGSGVGAASLRLAEKGYRVVAVVALPELVSHLAAADSHPALAFQAVDLAVDGGDPLLPGSFAAVLLHETAEMAAPGRLLARARTLLADGGTLVLAGEVAGGRAAAAGGPLPTAADLTIALAENGFRPLARESLAAQVLPTCAAMSERLRALRGEPALAGGAAAAAIGEALASWERRRDGLAGGHLSFELLAAKKDRFAMRTYRDGDEHEILSMFREAFGVSRTLAHWYWKFRDNPYGSHLVAETRSPEGELVAHYSGYPVPFYSSAAGGREFFSQQIGDTMTRPSVRQAGLGKSGILARMAAYYYAAFCAEIPFAYGFNTAHIRTLGERYLGYKYIDPVGYWVMDAPASTLRRPGRLARWISGHGVVEITAAGAELDDLFRRVRDSYGLLVRRDAAYVRWRYLDCPDRVHRVFALRRHGRLVGWCAFARRGADLVWGDALVDPRHVAALPGLLRYCIDGPYNGVERIWGWFAPHPSWWCAALASLGFAREREPNDLTPGFYLFDAPQVLQELAERWYYTYGDSDLF